MRDLLADIVIIMWKEWREFIRQRSTLIGMAVLLSVFGVLMPLQNANLWVNTAFPLMQAILLPPLLVLSIVTDGIAGERERHTLDTLLASRVSTAAVVLGKYAAVVVYAWTLIVAGQALALVTVNLSAGHGRLLLYPAPIATGAATFALLNSGLVAAAGMLVSLRAATVRQAAQMVSVGMMTIFFIMVTAFKVTPRPVKDALADAVHTAGPAAVAATAVTALLALDAGLLAAALTRFRRARLLLD